MGRILAIDYGTKRTGIAVSDPLKIIANSLETVPTHTLKEYIGKYIAANDVDTIVVGKPLKMDGTPSGSFPHVASLVRWLENEFTGMKVVSFDERFTSVLAHRAMIEGGVKKMARRDKMLVDRISATIILQGYMESLEYAKIKI